MSAHATPFTPGGPVPWTGLSGTSTVDPETFAHYEANARRYAERVSRSVPDGDLKTFIEALPAAHDPILDWGCGPGNTAALLEARGMSCVATDASPAMAEIGADRGVAIRVEPFEALAPLPRFRGIWSNFALMHVERPCFAPLVQRAAAALIPEGVLHLGLDFRVGHPGREVARQVRLDGCLMTLFRPEEILSTVRDAGLVPVSARTGRGRMLDGTPTQFHILLARKPGCVRGDRPRGPETPLRRSP